MPVAVGERGLQQRLVRGIAADHAVEDDGIGGSPQSRLTFNDDTGRCSGLYTIIVRREVPPYVSID